MEILAKKWLLLSAVVLSSVGAQTTPTIYTIPGTAVQITISGTSTDPQYQLTSDEITSLLAALAQYPESQLQWLKSVQTQPYGSNNIGSAPSIGAIVIYLPSLSSRLITPYNFSLWLPLGMSYIAFDYEPLQQQQEWMAIPLNGGHASLSDFNATYWIWPRSNSYSFFSSALQSGDPGQIRSVLFMAGVFTNLLTNEVFFYTVQDAHAFVYPSPDRLALTVTNTVVAFGSAYQFFLKNGMVIGYQIGTGSQVSLATPVPLPSFFASELPISQQFTRAGTSVGGVLICGLILVAILFGYRGRVEKYQRFPWDSLINFKADRKGFVGMIRQAGRGASTQILREAIGHGGLVDRFFVNSRTIKDYDHNINVEIPKRERAISKGHGASFDIRAMRVDDKNFIRWHVGKDYCSPVGFYIGMFPNSVPFLVHGELIRVRQIQSRPNVSCKGWYLSHVFHNDTEGQLDSAIFQAEKWALNKYLYRQPRPLRMYERPSIQQRRLSRVFSGLTLPFYVFKSAYSNADSENPDDCEQKIRQIISRNERVEVAVRFFCIPIFFALGCWLIYIVDPRWRILRRRACFGAGTSLIGLSFACGFLPVYWQQKYHRDNECHPQSHVLNVSQKVLTPAYFPYYTKYMANVLSTEKQAGIIGALCEGSSIRSIERMTGVHRDTIMRLGVRVGRGCMGLMDETMRGLSCTRLELDEIWGFVGKKQKNVGLEDDPSMGDVWTFCAIDADTKLVPSFMVGKRDKETANAFVEDLSGRMNNRLQISTDGLAAYVDAISEAFGNDVDFAQIIKTYGHQEVSNNRRYSAPDFVSSEKKVVIGNPDNDLISTSYVERLNATTRLHMRRLTRLTLAFSKKLDNFEAACGLHFAYYNFVKKHGTVKCTPAMAAGVTTDYWSVADLVRTAA